MAAIMGGGTGSIAVGAEIPVDPVARYVNEVIIHGSPARVVDELQRLRAQIGLDYLLCAPLNHQSFLLLTNEVLPAIARSSMC
jgi:alkanesulfonate monooxygenase SsuD/methylene tetrahydromethanopterin reductase-like flavin-dependent oxidoreductase (luciferase family)